MLKKKAFFFLRVIFKVDIFNMYCQMGKIKLLRYDDIPPLNSVVYGLKIGAISLEICQIR